jgi:hypothetical protein
LFLKNKLNRKIAPELWERFCDLIIMTMLEWVQPQSVVDKLGEQKNGVGVEG